MLTLAVDTSAEFGSVALVDEQETLEEILLHAPQGFSGILFAEIDGLLSRQNKTLQDIDLFAAASGPGSFTGVRIGLAAIKGLAEVMEKPAAAVSNLRALAAFGSARLRAPLIDARRGEVFAALFDESGAELIPESVLPFRRFLELTADHEFEWVCSAFDAFRYELTGTRFETLPVTNAPPALAASVARLAMRGPVYDPAVPEANYVRRSDAELLWKAQ